MVKDISYLRSYFTLNNQNIDFNAFNLVYGINYYFPKKADTNTI